MFFVKEDLLHGHYTWNNEDAKSIFAGTASRRAFNRFNGDQVLFLINLFAESRATFTIDDGRKLERMILDQLPVEPMSEQSVFNWLIAGFR